MIRGFLVSKIVETEKGRVLTNAIQCKACHGIRSVFNYDKKFWKDQHRCQCGYN